ncbi:MAG: beta-ketoacyl synthase [Polyangiales bacterium]
MREVVITGIGLILPNCDDLDTFWAHVSGGESQLKFEDDPFGGADRISCGRIANFDPAKYLAEIPERFYSRYHRELQIYLASLFLARDASQIELGEWKADRIGLFDGSSRTNIEFWYQLISRERAASIPSIYTRRELMTALPGGTVGLAASLLKTRGPAYAYSGTCSSGSIAIGHAYREIATSEIDLAFATGHDFALIPPVFAMYRDANLLSLEKDDARKAVRPYVGHSANAFGEGAVTLTLESREAAERRNAPILATILGYRYGNNGYHPTTVDVAGVRPAEILTQLLERTAVTPREVGFVVGHGNAVHLSDVSEENYMRGVFGNEARNVPLISTKPIYGHTLGASSSINTAAAALMLKHQYIIPTINIDERSLKRGTHHQPNRGCAAQVEVGISMSYGMGGHNTALLLRRYQT